MNDSLKHNCVARATETNVKICEIATTLIYEYDCMIDDDTNKYWEIFLGVLTSDNDEANACYIS